MSRKRVLITGANGFIGANLTRRLLADGHEVHTIVRGAPPHWRLAEIEPDLRMHSLDLRDATAVGAAIQTVRPEWVFHLAAHGGSSWQTDMREVLESNVAGTINLVEASLRRGFDAFVHAGSSSEYGFKDHAPAETDCLEPNSLYAVGKASATLLCRHLARAEGQPLVTLRLYSAFGPWEGPRRLMPTLVMRGFTGEWPPLVSPWIARDYVFVDDVVEAFVLAASRDHEPGAIYNVGSGVQTTVAEVVEMARTVLDIRADPIWDSMAPRTWDSAVWVSNNSAIKAALGWEARFSLEEGFRSLVDWFRDQPARCETYRAHQLNDCRLQTAD